MEREIFLELASFRRSKGECRGPRREVWPLGERRRELTEAKEEKRRMSARPPRESFSHRGRPLSETLLSELQVVSGIIRGSESISDPFPKWSQRSNMFLAETVSGFASEHRVL